MKSTFLSILVFAAVSTQGADSTLGLLAKHLAIPDAQRPPVAKQNFAHVSLTKADAAQAQQMLWSNRAARIRPTRMAEMKAKVIKLGGHAMRFEFFVYGKKPAGGRSLFISLHGGGNAPARVNDSQWNNQKRLYRPAEGVYVAPRAPTNTWNLWHQGHIDGLFDRLIENFIVLHDVNPNRVYLMGYSAGGDGVYQLAPRMADRFAAAAMMAGHPNETSPLGLRNLAFTLHVGERDSGYNRNKVAANWKTQLAALRKADPKGYIHHVQIHRGLGHWMNRRDAVAVPWMAKHTRNPLPTRIVWKQDDVTHSTFYWLAVPANETGGRPQLTATIEKQKITLEGPVGKTVFVRLNDQLANLEQPITVVANGKKIFTGKTKRTIVLLAQTLADRRDPHLMFSAQVEVKLPARR
jgi:poly(3-hydroxybutyrate) depolymerase